MNDQREGWFQTKEGEWLPDSMFYDPALPHLGGYLKGGDAGSYYPPLWAWALEHFKIGSVIDVGCGEGHAIRWFRDRGGCRVVGVEGIPQLDPNIVQHDYTAGPYEPAMSFDLVWSCEFVEHVEECYVSNFLATFRAAPLLMMTHATGTGGHHHVNAQPSGYWIDLLERDGWRFDWQLTQRARIFTPYGYFRHTGLIFLR